MQFESERLVFRPFAPSDFEVWTQGYANRKQAQNEFDVGQVPPQSKKYFYDFVSLIAILAREDKMYIFGAFDKTDGKFIGVLELLVFLRSDFEWGSIGISVHNQFWNCGYGTEMAQSGVNFAKDTLQFRRLESAIEKGNNRSERIFAKLGFEFECTRKSFAKIEGTYTDMNIFVKLL